MIRLFRRYLRLWKLTLGSVDEIPEEMLWKIELSCMLHGLALGLVLITLLNRVN